MTEELESVKEQHDNADIQNHLVTTVKDATKLASIRLLIFGIILITTLFSVYSIITNPDFLHSALSFKSIEDDEGVNDLVGYSIEISERTRTQEELLGSLSSVTKRISDYDLNQKNIVERIIGDASIRLGKTNIQKSKKTFPIVISYSVIGRSSMLEKTTNLLFSGDITFSDAVAKKIIEEKYFYFEDSSGARVDIIKYFTKEPSDEKSLITQYKINLESNLKNVAEETVAVKTQIEKLNAKMLGVIKRLRSDEYIYASVVLQKVMITMLIVSIGLYFLKAIGTDLLFIRKLGLINLSQSIANGGDNASTQDIILAYNTIVGEEEKTGKAPDTVPMKTLSEISKILSSQNKK